MNYIEIKNLKKIYDDMTIWTNVSLNLEAGKIIGLIGANGTGKSTLFKSILGVVNIDEGEIKYNIDLDTDVGYLLEIDLFEYMTAKENLYVLGLYTGEKYNKNQIIEVLDTVGLKDVENKKVSEFSFGMKQRLRLALAIIVPRKVLILDEPLVGLDPDGVKDFINTIEKIVVKDKTSVLISTHQIADIASIFDEYYYLKNHSLHLGPKNTSFYSIELKSISLNLKNNLENNFTKLYIRNNKIISENISETVEIIDYLKSKNIFITDIEKHDAIESEVFSDD